MALYHDTLSKDVDVHACHRSEKGRRLKLPRQAIEAGRVARGLHDVLGAKSEDGLGAAFGSRRGQGERHRTGRGSAHAALEAFAQGYIQFVDLADEGGDEEVHRVLVDVPGSADLLDFPEIHDGDSVGNDEGFLLVVGDIDGGDPEMLLDRTDLVPHLYPQFGVEVGERLVEEENAGLNGHGAGEAHALLLAARKLVGCPALVALQVDTLERRLYFNLDILG